ncbi:MAG: hypothetical protein M3457_02250, partial [Chloroflexota bacterium]|nr:hypothetical protein [Chloroflexota bacterium]
VSMLLTDEDHLVDQATTSFPDHQTYYTTIYQKAGLGFDAARQAIGDEAFVADLQHYAETMLFAVASPEDLQAAFAAASGSNLDDLWYLWFETASGRVEIVMESTAATPVASPGAPHRQ